MEHIETVLNKMGKYSTFSDGVRGWTAKNCEAFRCWLVKYLKRNPSARNEFMPDIPKRYNNTDYVLDHFSKQFVMQCGFKLSEK